MKQFNNHILTVLKNRSLKLPNYLKVLDNKLRFNRYTILRIVVKLLPKIHSINGHLNALEILLQTESPKQSDIKSQTVDISNFLVNLYQSSKSDFKKIYIDSFITMHECSIMIT